MIKKFLIIVFFTLLIASCGKKSDPVYNEQNQSSKITSTLISTFS